jgi:hypothetical protein
MKRILVIAFLQLSCPAFAQNPQTPALKGILLEQLRTTHSQKDWFVPANTALEGLTPEQASWKDGSGNHSIGQLANHLVFWNRQQLAKFRGEQPPKFSGDNEETFNSFDRKSWNSTVKELDDVLSEWEKAVEASDESKLKSWASTIAHIGTHNAYHKGSQIISSRMRNEVSFKRTVECTGHLLRRESRHRRFDRGRHLNLDHL